MLDPYVYPDSDVLINKFNIRDADKLQQIENAIFLKNHTFALPQGKFDYDHLKAIHKHYFEDLYAWAGQERTVNISKGASYFGNHQYIAKELQKTFSQLAQDNHLKYLLFPNFTSKLAHYFNEINAAHPFREGNGRTLQTFCELISHHAGYILNWRKTGRYHYIEASVLGFAGDNAPMTTLFQKICVPINRQVIDNIQTLKTLNTSISKKRKL